jgi:aspartate aminotransferase-like enzyme
MEPHDKLFIPGPVEVSAKTLAAFSRPMIGHRGEDFKNLYRDIHPQLQTLFGTSQPVFLSTSSAWGVMEGSLRNLVKRGVLDTCGRSPQVRFGATLGKCPNPRVGAG